jgi:di/tricarboxylate transporter
VRQSRFRSVHNAAIIAVRRHGEKLQGRIGDIVLRPGDVLLLETSAGFVETHGGSPSFHLVSTVQGFQPVRHNRSWLATTLLFLMVIGLASGFLSPVLTVWIAALAMVTFRCTSTSSARRSIDFSVLVTIGAAIGIGSAISNSGLGSLVGEGLVEFARSLGGGPHLAMAAIVVSAILISQLATNYGGAVIVFPIAMSTALAFGANPVPFMLAVMAGAGSNFLTPIAYQTNLMVYGPGRYRFTDYARLGLGLQLIVLLSAVFLIPLFFPF